MNVHNDQTDVIENFRIHEKDTGSAHVQIALMTKKIAYLGEHLKKHPKDHTVQRRLKQTVEYRRTMQKYLGSKSKEQLVELNNKLGLRN